MDKDVERANARVLLQSRERQRHHWSSVITTLMGYTLIANAAIWSFFANSYIQHINKPPEVYSAFIIAAALSAVSVGMWRCYVRHLDDQAAQLYPEILRYEIKLSVVPTEGIRGYLRRYIEGLDSIWDKKDDEPIEVIQELVRLKRIGGRVHFVTDIVPLLFNFSLIIFGILGFQWAGYTSRLVNVEGFPWLQVSCLFLISYGFGLTLFARLYYQQKPLQEDIGKVVIEIEKRDKKQTTLKPPSLKRIIWGTVLVTFGITALLAGIIVIVIGLL